jgi:hypothetical protein
MHSTQYVEVEPEQTIVSPAIGNVAGTMLTVLIVGFGQLSGGVQPFTLSEIVPEGPLPQITVQESDVGGGGVRKVPPVTAQV